MKKTLWAYGCSWTHSLEHEKKYNLKFWPEHLANKIQYNFVNNGLGGNSIFKSTIDLIRQLDKIERGDVVVFQFSYPDRFSVPYVNATPVTDNWGPKDIFNIPDVLIDFNYHEIDYFLNEKFYNKDKIQKYIDFILDYRIELLVFSFRNIIPIFDYIETKIGAKVKYWFINTIHGSIKDMTEKRKHNLFRTLFDSNKTILFPIEDDSFNLDADKYILEIKQRYSETYMNYGAENEQKLMTDYHPNDVGQEIIANIIFDSLKNDK